MSLSIQPPKPAEKKAAALGFTPPPPPSFLESLRPIRRPGLGVRQESTISSLRPTPSSETIHLSTRNPDDTMASGWSAEIGFIVMPPRREETEIEKRDREQREGEDDDRELPEVELGVTRLSIR